MTKYEKNIETAAVMSLAVALILSVGIAFLLSPYMTVAQIIGGFFVDFVLFLILSVFGFSSMIPDKEVDED